MIKRIDWHAHILPQMDDGSASVEESLDMLKLLADSGVEAVALTPHFYPDRSYPAAFLKDREESYQKLQTIFFEGMPKLLLGAEVAYFDGLRTCDDMRSLVIEQTNCLLIEMPMRAWNERMFENILRLAKRIEITPVLAHIDRYFLRRNDWELIAQYLDEGGLVQGNAEFFVHNRASERRALNLFDDGVVQLLGSDCHNMTKRPPMIGKAFDIVDQKASVSAIAESNRVAETLLK